MATYSITLFDLTWTLLLMIKSFIDFSLGLMNGSWKEFQAIFMDSGWRKPSVLMNIAIGLKR